MVGPGVGFPSDSFYLQNLTVLRTVYHEWSTSLPNVKPYYAVKCNPDQEVVSVLATLGSNFDCASPAEIQQVLDLNVDPGRILYANPCKKFDDILFAKSLKVLRTTFDSVCELKKIARAGGDWDLILRIRADDPNARCNLGVKYGAEENDWDILLFTARALGLNVVGISFHVGSFASSHHVFTAALEKAHRAAELAKEHGYSPNVIDIGGGFSSSSGLPKGIQSDYELVAEPGRFFVEKVSTLFTPVIGTKGSGITISESLYGAFNCVLFDHAAPVLKACVHADGTPLTGEPIPMTIFGSTCDGGDIIYKDALVPSDIQEDDWLVWENMGAYTSAATTRFNGFPFNDRKKIYIE